MELTQEFFESYFEEKLASLATKDDLKPLATRQDVRDAVEELARITSEGFADVQQRFDVVARVQHLEGDMQKIKQALHIS